MRNLFVRIGVFTPLAFVFFVLATFLMGCGGGSTAPVSQSKPPASSPPPTTPPPTTPPPTTPPPTTPPTQPPPTNPPPTNPPPPPPPTTTGPVNLGNGQNPVSEIESNGTIDVAFDTGSGIAIRRSTDKGMTFSAPVVAVTAPESMDEFQFKLDDSDKFYILSVYTVPNAVGPTVLLTTGDGQNFTTNPVPSNGFFPQIAVIPDGSSIDVLWLDSISSDLHSRLTADGGKTFSPDRILWKAGTNDAIDIVVLAGTQGEIYVIWGSEADTTCDLLFTVSFDAGVSFSQPVDISPKDGGCHVDPNPKVDSKGFLNIAWNEGGASVLFSRSADRGQTFSTPAFAITNGIEVNAQDFSIGPNDEVDLVYDAAAFGDNFDVFFVQSLDHGATFSAPVKLNLPTIQNFTGGGDPSIGVDSDDKITVAWEDDSNGAFSGDNDIYARASTDGKTFTDAVDLSNTTDQQEVFPMVTEAIGGLYLTWFDTANSMGQVSNLNVFFDSIQ